MNKLFLLDAYALIYRSYYAFINNPRINSKGMNTSAIMGFVNVVNEVLTHEHPTHIAVVFDPSGPTFRHKEYPAYKAQREESPEDIKRSVPYIKRILAAWNISVLEVEGYEADDVIGTVATKAGEQGILTYMLTPDKDYGQLVKDNVLMYKPMKGRGFETLGPKEITDKYGIERPTQVIDMLGLMGDTSDNIPGCPGVGEKTASKLIREYGSVENLLSQAPSIKGAIGRKLEENKEKIMLSKHLATICTDVPMSVDIDALKLKQADGEKMRQLFAELEFKNLANRLLHEEEEAPEKKTATETDRFTEAEKKRPSEPSLFAEMPTDGQGEGKYAILRGLKDVAHDYQLIENEGEMKKLCDFLLTKEFVSIDTETTSLSTIDAELVGMSFAVEEFKAYYVPVGAERQKAQRIVNIFKPLYEDQRILKIGQNLKYDIEVLHNYGVEVRGKMFDTMIAHYIVQPELHHNMDYLAEIYLNYRTIHIDELIGARGKSQKNMRDMEPSAVYEYAAEDADVTLRLKGKLEGELDKYGCRKLFEEIEMPLMPVLAAMETAGVRIDTTALREISATLTNRINAIEKEIEEMAGEPFKVSSPRQVGNILFEKLRITEKPKKTKTGQYVTSEEVLQALRSRHPIVDKILEYRMLKKLLSTYVDALPSLINPRTGHIHTSFNQTVTATGRLSSSDPNLQNIPVRGEEGKEIRRAFVADPGCLFFSADYSQIELRVMAHLSGDDNMIRAFREGRDIHAATAAEVYKVDIAEVTREQRGNAKRANFGIIYGITPFGLAERLGISQQEARQLIDGYFATFPKVHEYIERSKREARQRGYVETLFGRRRYLPDINSRNATVRAVAERNAINAPIQGTAADIIKMAMVRIYERMRAEGMLSKMILQVHDELNFSVLPSEKERIEQIVIHEMEHAIKLSVPLTVDSGWGSNWLEAH